MREIPLTKGYTALVDDGDFECVSQSKWCAAVRHRRDGSIRNVYAARGHHRGRRTLTLLHRFILGVTDPKIEVDHEDHNGLNCQRYNMRIANRSDNIGNSRKSETPFTSKFKGVSWHKQAKKWQAGIKVNYKQTHLGLFSSEEAAARAYDTAANKRFGEFACVNFPKANENHRRRED